MLILTRGLEQSLFLIDGDKRTEVKIVRVNGKEVRIGIEAPPEVVIVRGELDAFGTKRMTE